MIARVHTIALEGITARSVEVEVHLASGLPSLNMVGLPDGAVREAKDRVRSALTNSGHKVPPRRVTINLAPADLPKAGSAYDLPMAIGLLTAMGVIQTCDLEGRLFIGELSLDGRLKPVSGCLPASIHARNLDHREIIVPVANVGESALVPDMRIIGAETLSQLIGHLRGDTPISPAPCTKWDSWLGQNDEEGYDLADVKGQEYAKRALEVAAAGGHNLFMTGPPGSGKTLLSRCLPALLPAMTLEEALEVTAIYSVSGQLTNHFTVVGRRPFRAPHHTATRVALIGGGSSGTLRPGEVSLAHRGVLFLDEIPEFGRNTLEVLREPLEANEVVISRAARSSRFPADFQLVAACNPCPCGHLGDPHHPCVCSRIQISRYQARLSGPLLDRIDIHVEVPPVPYETLVALPSGESSKDVCERVSAARKIQLKRNGPSILNANLRGSGLEQHTALDSDGKNLLLQASQRLGFSARAFHRILKVARTIADLDQSPHISSGHLAEAVQYRSMHQNDANSR